MKFISVFHIPYLSLVIFWDLGFSKFEIKIMNFSGSNRTNEYVQCYSQKNSMTKNLKENCENPKSQKNLNEENAK